MPNYTPPQGAGDALMAQELGKLKAWIDWLSANGQTGKGSITEVGIPGSCQGGTDPIPYSGTGALYDRQWAYLLQQYVLACNAAGVSITYWNASNWRIDLTVYRTDDGTNKTLNFRTTTSEVVELAENLSSGQTLRGVNLAGAEFADRGPSGSLDRARPFEPGAGYYYPKAADYAVLFSRGMKLIRIPVRLERLQPTLKGDLDLAEMALFKASVDGCIAAGCTAMIDFHNYGKYDTTPTGENTNGVKKIGENAPNGISGTMTDCFADGWKKVVQYFNYIDPTKLQFDIMNEPSDLPGGADTWKEASRQIVEAIRTVNQGSVILVPGYFYNSLPSWVSTNGSSAWLTEIIPVGQIGAGQTRNTDPLIRWNAHHYFDQNANGGYEPNETYAATLSQAQNNGYTSWATSGYVPSVLNITSQVGARLVFTSTFDAAVEFGGVYDPLTGNGNKQQTAGTVIFPDSSRGNPGTSLRINSVVGFEDNTLRKSLTGAQNSRVMIFDFLLSSAKPISLTDNFNIVHTWGNGNSNDLVEVVIQGSGTGFVFGIKKTTTGYPTVMGTTVVTKDTWQKVRLEVTDTAFTIYLGDSLTAEATMTSANAGLNIGGIALGQFYSGQALTFHFDNLQMGLNATYDAPPNGGKLTAVVAPPTPPGGRTSGLIGLL